MNLLKNSFLKLAGTSMVLGFVMTLQPLSAYAAGYVWSNPGGFVLTQAQEDEPMCGSEIDTNCLETSTNAGFAQTAAAAAEAQASAKCSSHYYPNQGYLGADGNCYPEPSVTEATTIATTTAATTTIPASTTIAPDQQSEIVALLTQLIALETQLVQLQSGQTK